MILLIGGEKGGSGKTTLALNLAATAVNAGVQTLLVDCDTQASAAFWAAIRDEDASLRRVPSIQRFGRTAGAEVREMARHYPLVIVDSGGRDSAEMRSCMLVAHRMLIPVQATQLDLWTCEKMAAIVADARMHSPGLDAAFLLTRAATNLGDRTVAEARQFLQALEGIGILGSVIRERVAYSRSPSNGRAVSEMFPRDARAHAEISYLYEEVIRDQARPA